MIKQYFVYIMANTTGTLYIGVTNNLARRCLEHKMELTPGFTKDYHCTRLVYFEKTNDILSAITREKQLKKWRRAKKEGLIGSMNPTWKDLSKNW